MLQIVVYGDRWSKVIVVGEVNLGFIKIYYSLQGTFCFNRHKILQPQDGIFTYYKESEKPSKTKEIYSKE